MAENKQEILDLLLPALRKTRNLYDLKKTGIQRKPGTGLCNI